MNVFKQTLSKSFPIIRDILIFSAAIVTIVFNYLAYPVREDIRSNTKAIRAVESDISNHKSDNTNSFNRFDSSLNTIIDKIDGVNTRLSRIEGKLEK